MLLEAGATPDEATVDGETPLFLAAKNGHLQIAWLLLKAGAAPNRPRSDAATPLIVASQQGHFDIADLLLEAGAGSPRDGGAPRFAQAMSALPRVAGVAVLIFALCTAQGFVAPDDLERLELALRH
eukprot:Skav209352  [mRNA]  locus=scaffold241:704968:705345:- [translate_table: standard]